MKNTEQIVFFLETIQGHEKGIDVLTTGVGEREWVGRTISVPNDDDSSMRFSFYILPLDESSALIFCPFRSSPWLTKLVSSLDEYNIPGYRNAWPKLMAALKNGRDDNYSHGDAPALICFTETPTDESDIWGVAVKIDNVDFKDVDTEYMYKKVIWASNYAIEMLDEYQKNEVSTTDTLIGGAKKGYNVWRIARTVLKAVSMITGAVGAGSVISGDE